MNDGIGDKYSVPLKIYERRHVGCLQGHRYNVSVCLIIRDTASLPQTYTVYAGPSFLTGVVGQSQPSVGREGTSRVRWPVSKRPMSTKPICRTHTSVSRLTYTSGKNS